MILDDADVARPFPGLRSPLGSVPRALCCYAPRCAQKDTAPPLKKVQGKKGSSEYSKAVGLVNVIFFLSSNSLTAL